MDKHTPGPRRLKFSRFGLAENPLPGAGHRGYHVKWSIGARTYLGEVVSLYRDEARGVTMLCVRHFNGENAPVVAASYVEVIG